MRMPSWSSGMPIAVDAEPREARQRALVVVLLADHGVAARQQRAVDEIERLRASRTRIRMSSAVHVDAGVALELADEELAQRPVALRSVRQIVGREIAPLALERRRRRRDQLVDRHFVRVVVAAGEIVLRQIRSSAPPAGGEPAGSSGAKSKACVMTVLPLRQG